MFGKSVNFSYQNHKIWGSHMMTMKINVFWDVTPHSQNVWTFQRQKVPLQHHYTSIRLHGVIPSKPVIFKIIYFSTLNHNYQAHMLKLAFVFTENTMLQESIIVYRLSCQEWYLLQQQWYTISILVTGKWKKVEQMFCYDLEVSFDDSDFRISQVSLDMWKLLFSHYCWWRLKPFLMSYCVKSWELCHFGAACCLHLQGLAAVFFTAKSMKMETAHYSKMSVPVYQTTWLNIREKRKFSSVDIFPHFTENTKHCIMW